MTDPSWQDDKPWSAVDAELDLQRDQKEREEKGQKSVNVPFSKIIQWIKNIFKR